HANDVGNGEHNSGAKRNDDFRGKRDGTIRHEGLLASASGREFIALCRRVYSIKLSSLRISAARDCCACGFGRADSAPAAGANPDLVKFTASRLKSIVSVLPLKLKSPEAQYLPEAAKL